MKSPSSALLASYKSGYTLKCDTKVYAEFNMNNYVSSTVSDNGKAIDDDTWDDNWPKASVTSANRPPRGIVRARFSTLTGSASDDRANAAGFKMTDKFVDSKPNPRYYLVSPDDTYKYWSSYQVTKGSGNGTYFFTDEQNLRVVYENSVKINKIVIGLETSEALPRNHYVQISTDGTNWSTIATSPAVADDGRITLWFSDTWIAGNKPSNFTNASGVNIRGIKFGALGMSKQGAPLSIIEISGRLEQDFSNYINDEGHDMEVADRSNIAPIGKASSNKASLNLDNTTKLFYNENSASPYYNLLDKNVKMWCDYVINGETFRQWTMFTENWSNQMSVEVSVELYDNAEYLQNTKTTAVFWEGLTTGSIIWRLLDMAGVAEWNYSSSTDDVIAVPFYWNDPDATVWDNIQAIAESTQTAIYFDEYNVAQIKNAKTLFSNQPPATWNFSAVDSTGSLADIIQMEKSQDFTGANQVDIKYTETKFTDFNNGLPKMEVVWEPDGTIALRACSLLESMTVDQNYFVIPQDEAATWPLKGMVNIEGELISYEGKMYRAYNFVGTANSYTTKIIKSEDERKKLDEQTPEGIRWRNGYTGYFNITKRGDLGTTPKAHSIDSKYRYTYELVRGGTAAVEHWAGGVTRNPSTSTVTLKGRSDMNWSNLYTLRSTESAYATNYRYGTRMRIPSGQPKDKGAGGIYIKGGSNSAGFFINLAATEVVEATQRASRNELRFQIRTVAGDQPMKNYIPAPIQINRDTWYDLEASTVYNSNDGSMNVTVYIDGQAWYYTNIKSNEVADPYGRFGVFIQDNCTVEFDYLYAVGTASYGDPDESNFYDNVKGGFISNYFDKIVPYKAVTPGVISRGTRNASPSVTGTGQEWLEEFGPVVHEVRRFDIDFEKNPVAHSYLYFSNTNQAVCPGYVADSFGATFLLANAYRRNVVINGEDTLTYGEDNSIDQKIFVYGRCFSDEEQQTETVKNDLLIRKRGLSVLTFESKFIQSQESAKRLGDWIVSHWGAGAEEFSVEVFGNPFISLGDIVTVNYPEKMINATQKFIVVGINANSGQGITTSLTLRKL